MMPEQLLVFKTTQFTDNLKHLLILIPFQTWINQGFARTGRSFEPQNVLVAAVGEHAKQSLRRTTQQILK